MIGLSRQLFRSCPYLLNSMNGAVLLATDCCAMYEMRMVAITIHTCTNNAQSCWCERCVGVLELYQYGTRYERECASRECSQASDNFLLSYL